MNLIFLVWLCDCNCGGNLALESAFTYMFGSSPDIAWLFIIYNFKNHCGYCTWKYRPELICAEIKWCIFFHETWGNFTRSLTVLTMVNLLTVKFITELLYSEAFCMSTNWKPDSKSESEETELNSFPWPDKCFTIVCTYLNSNIEEFDKLHFPIVPREFCSVFSQKNSSLSQKKCVDVA